MQKGAPGLLLLLLCVPKAPVLLLGICTGEFRGYGTVLKVVFRLPVEYLAFSLQQQQLPLLYCCTCGTAVRVQAYTTADLYAFYTVTKCKY